MTMISRSKINRSAYWILGLLALGSAAQAAQSQIALTGHIARQLESAAMLERAPADEPVELSLVVNVDQNLLNDTLDTIYGRNAPQKRRYLSSSEFAQKFDLATKRQALKDFAQGNGLTVDSVEDNPNSLVVKVSGPAQVVEKAFNVRLNHYRSPSGQVFRAHDTEPMIPATLAPHLISVLGLSNFAGAAHPHLRHPTASAQALGGPRAFISGGTGPHGGLSPVDIKAIYGLSSTSLTGSGQKAALFELDGYTPSDITLYETQFSLPNVPITFVGVGGATNTPGAGAIEVTLDIELLIALAPGLTQILDYGGLNTEAGRVATYSRISADNTAKVVSTSWGLDEQDTDPAEISAENVIFGQMATQGQSMYAAAGDCGSYDQVNNLGACVTTNGFRVDNPASQPYVTGVGGTSLSGSVSSPVETTWNEFASAQPSGGGGGVSAVWPLPSYQLAVAGTASQTFRNVPDVALNADPNTSPYSICMNGSCSTCVPGNCLTLIGGTSAAAPLWAAVTALINQERASLGTGNFGFANASLYQLATSTSSAVVFSDVTTGNNGVSGHYNAGVGYDDATGWGSFKGAGIVTNGGTIVQAPNLDLLNNVYAYPNPWDTRTATKRQVTLANVPDDATINIFTLSGFWVKTLSASNTRAVWDLTNDKGDRVASGLYFYLVKTPQATFHGEIAIIK